MNKLFSIKDFQTQTVKYIAKELPTQDKLTLKFLHRHYLRIENIKALMGKTPEPEELYFLWTLKSFNAFSFIVYVIKNVGTIDELTFSSYSINERILTSLVKWYDAGQIKKINIFISESFEHRVPRLSLALKMQAETRGFFVKYIWNHSKVTLMQVAEKKLVVEGSGNFSENANFEQYLFAHSSDLYNFRYKCLFETT